jgi:hypothetical protein
LISKAIELRHFLKSIVVNAVASSCGYAGVWTPMVAPSPVNDSGSANPRNVACARRRARLSRKNFLLILRKMRMMCALKTKARLKFGEFDREAANAA